jgi:hypothetical protein
MPLNLSADLLETSDISASATDFQADGTAAPGATGRVADAGHVHPAGSLGYQIVTQEASSAIGGAQWPITLTVGAPTGCKVVGGGFSLDTASSLSFLVANAPLADGSGWTVQGEIHGGGTGYTMTVYAICVNA